MKRLLFVVLASLLLSTSIPSMTSANSASSLVTIAQNHLGTPYSYGGTTTSGFDCSGFTQYVFKKAGVSIPRTTGQQYTMGTAVAKSNLQTGDIVFFNTSGKGISHNGIYIGSGKFIHASTSQGVMISSINDPAYWGSKYIGAKRVKNFTNETSVASVPKANEVKYASRGEIAEILAMELNLDSTNAETAFSDVPASHSNYDAIVAVTNAGIFSGNSLGQFKPEDQLTRAELAKVLVGAFHLEGSTDASFKDVPDSHWAKEPISTLFSLDITTGYGDGNFGVNDKVTANQFKLFISRINH